MEIIRVELVWNFKEPTMNAEADFSNSKNNNCRIIMN